MQFHRFSAIRLLAALTVVISFLAYTEVPLSANEPKSKKHVLKYNHPGNLLLADQFNNRVVEIATDGTIVWQFGLGPNDTSPHSILGVNDAQRVGHFTLMAGTGIPPARIQRSPMGSQITACCLSPGMAACCGNTVNLASLVLDPTS